MTPAAWLGLLGRASLEGGLLVMVVWIVAAIGRGLPPAARALLWWAVSARLLLALLPLAAVNIPVANPLPALSRSVAARIATHADWSGASILPVASSAEPDAAGSVATGATPVATRPSLAPLRAAGHVLAAIREIAKARMARAPWPAAMAALAWALCALWGAGVVWRIRRWVREAVAIERAWARAEAIDDVAITAWLAPWLGAAARRVEVRVSGAFATPLVIGGAVGRILVPSGFAALPPGDRRAALAHEAAHLRRYDLSFGTVVAAAECAFWFHPLVLLAAHEYALAREEACDAEAMRLSGTAADRYGELLLRLGLETSPPTRVAVSCGSRQAGQLRRRIIMLAHASSRSRTRRVGAAALVLFACATLLPLRFIAPATASGSSGSPPDRTISLHGRTTIVSHDGDSSDESGIDAHEFSFGRRHAGNWFFWGTFDGQALAKLKRLEAGADQEDVFWFRDHDRAYFVHDPEALAHVSELLGPLEELSNTQSHFGDEQSKLGDRQSSLGEREAALSEEEAKLDSKLDDLEQQIEELNAEHRPAGALDRKRAELFQRQAGIHQRQQRLEREIDELDRMQESLGDTQDELDARSEKLMDGVVSEIHDFVRPLVESGKAQPAR